MSDAEVSSPRTRKTARGNGAVRPSPALRRRPFFLGALCGALCMLLWGFQPVVMRLGVLQGFTPADITAIRFAVAGVLLLPVAVRYRPLPVGSLGWGRALALFALAGAPYSFLMVLGATYAPAVHGATIMFGTMPVATALLSRWLLSERITTRRGVAVLACLLGMALFGYQELFDAAAPASDLWIGHACFFLVGCSWGTFSTLAKRWNVNPWSAASTISVLSLLSLPLWAIGFQTGLPKVTWAEIVFQAVYMGLMVGVVSLVLYQLAVSNLGPVLAVLFLSPAPFVAWIAGALVFGEQLRPLAILGLVAVVLGLAASTGCPKPTATREAAS